MTVDVADGVKGAIERAPIEFDDSGSASIALALAPGAASLRVIAREGEDVVAWIEVPAQPGEQIMVEFRRDAAGEVRAGCQGKPFFILPDENPPDPILINPPATQDLDLVVLVDGTCLHPAGEKTAGLAYLLAPEMAGVWREVANGIGEFVTLVSARYSRIWTTAIAFGDEPMENVANLLLKPAYHLYPPADGRQILKQVTPQQLVEQLCRIPFSPGGDFVDALADGLNACVDVSWRGNSRRLVLVLGQSPGYSVLDAPDDMSDFLIRKACIEEEGDALHAKKIEVVTAFHDPTNIEERYSTQKPDVLQRAREQYSKLASLPEWTCASTEAGLRELANRWMNPPALIARGPSPGVLATAS